MDFESSELSNHYNRWEHKIIFESSQMPLCNKSISALEVLKAHFLICDYFYQNDGDIGGLGPRDINLLLSAVSRQFTSFNGVERHKTDYERCATLFFGLIKNHPFHDGNKRTAFLIAIYQLWKIGRLPDEKHKKFETLAVRTAEGKLKEYSRFGDLSKKKKHDNPEVKFLAHFFKKNTRSKDKSMYLLTYRQLDNKLRNYSFKLDHQDRNFIHVVRINEKRKLLKTKKVEQKIYKIGFPGWSKEVAKSVMNKVLKETKLNAQYGYDSKVFFHDTEPLPALISLYHGILMKLKNK
ncbi:type II toxin-antitoxin system death-on-curing family toxin [Thermodesulfobacteriota bacterium]